MFLKKKKSSLGCKLFYNFSLLHKLKSFCKFQISNFHLLYLIVPEPCNPNPCANGGVCIDNNGAPNCKCIFPYVGTTCNGEFFVFLVMMRGKKHLLEVNFERIKPLTVARLLSVFIYLFIFSCKHLISRIKYSILQIWTKICEFVKLSSMKMSSLCRVIFNNLPIRSSHGW